MSLPPIDIDLTGSDDDVAPAITHSQEKCEIGSSGSNIILQHGQLSIDICKPKSSANVGANAFLKRRAELEQLRDAKVMKQSTTIGGSSTRRNDEYSNSDSVFAIHQNRIETYITPPPTDSSYLDSKGTVDIMQLISSFGSLDKSEVWLSNYMTNFEWLGVRFKSVLEEPKHLLFFSHSESGYFDMLRRSRHSTDKVSRLIVPELPQYGTHHSKAAIVFQERSCRVIIHTANYLQGDLHHMCEGVWYQDFPLHQSAGKVTSEPCPFNDYLCEYFEHILSHASRVSSHNNPKPGYCRSLLQQFDMSRAKGHLAASVPGLHSGRDLYRWGHPRVKWLINKYARSGICNWPFVAQFTSVGSQKQNWAITELAKSFCPESHKPPSVVSLVLPTKKEVESGLIGEAAGASIPVASKYMFTPPNESQGGHPIANNKQRFSESRDQRNPFVRTTHSIAQPFATTTESRLCKFSTSAPIPSRVGSMPHIKTYTRYNPENPSELAWVMLTSSNLSKAAWGYYTSQKQDKLKLLSYELGIVIFPNGNELLSAYQDTPACADVKNRMYVPLPYSLPPVKYTSDDIPWTV